MHFRYQPAGSVELRNGEAAASPVLIEARTLTSCRHRLRLDSTLGRIVDTGAEDAGVQLRREAAAAYREHVRDTLTRNDSSWVRIDPSLSARERATATMQACVAGAARIWGAVLPLETDTGRRGKSEILLRDDERGGYRPVIVVNHKVTDPRSEGGESAPAITSDLYEWRPKEEPTRKVRPQLRDQLRLAHLYRMLQRHGLASPSLLGGVIGLGFEYVLVQDVSLVLDEYDRRYGDRIAVARGQAETAPSSIPECRSCPWWSRCSDELASTHDVSLVAAGSRAEVLREEGVRTIDQLAEWEGEAPRQWQHGSFEDVVVAAKAWLRGVTLVRRQSHVQVHRADVEVDVDLESYQDHGAYLWGTLLDGVYRPFVTWDPLPTVDEARSFAEFWTWLMQVRADADAAGKTFAAYCYSRSAEDKWLLDSAQRFAGIAGVPTDAEIREFIDSPQWVDIYQAVNEQFVCPAGKGLKRIAPMAGFSWRDPEAGGEASMGWYRRAVGYDGEPEQSQRTRILEYNEDDVLATMTLREWMSGPADAEVPAASEL